MPKYRKKPVVIEAWQMPISYKLLEKLNIESDRNIYSEDTELIENVFIDTLEGTMEAKNDDWIIKGVEGEFYPCKDSVFQATYEKEEED